MRYGDVKIEGGPIANNITLTDVASGQPIKGCTAADVEVRAGAPIRVHLHLMSADLNLSGKPTFMVADPRTGKMRAVAKVVFADGDEWAPVTDD